VGIIFYEMALNFDQEAKVSFKIRQIKRTNESRYLDKGMSNALSQLNP